jgi:hypothetical protein
MLALTPNFLGDNSLLIRGWEGWGLGFALYTVRYIGRFRTKTVVF